MTDSPAQAMDLNSAEQIIGELERLAMIYSAPAQSRQWPVLLALRETVLRIATLGSEAAELQQLWWQEEITRLNNGSPRHPLCTELQKLDSEKRCEAHWLNEYLIEVRARLNNEQAQSHGETRLRLYRVFGTPFLQLQAMNAVNPNLEPSTLTRLSIAFAYHQRASGNPVAHRHWAAAPDSDSPVPSGKSQTRELSSAIDQELMNIPWPASGVRFIDMLDGLIRFDNRRRLAGQSPAPLRRAIHAWRLARRLGNTNDRQP